jgi:hypothetical protein
MSQKAIVAALETALLTVSTMVTAYPNVDFTPPNLDTPYQRVNTLFATPENAEIGSARRFEQGYMQVDFCFPKNKGDGPAREAASLVAEYFYRGRTLTHSGVRVLIRYTPEVSSGTDEGDRWVVPCKIPFYSQI